MPVRLLVLLTADLESDASGGIRTYVRDLVKHSPADFEIEIIGSTAEPRLRPTGVWREVRYGQRSARILPLVHIPPNGGLVVPDLVRFVAALLLRRRRVPVRGRIVELHRPAMGLAFLRHHGPRIQWLHMNTLDGIAQLRWRRLPGLFRLAERLTLRGIDRVYLPSRASVADLRRRYPGLAERIRFAPNWFDGERFRPPTAVERSAARAWLAGQAGVTLGADVPVVLFVGRLEPVKDPELLLAGFAALSRERSEARLVVLGDGRLRDFIRDRAGALGIGQNVHLLGARPPDDVARAMRGADVLLIASRSEASARVALESLGSGLPVVATRVGEMADVVHHAVTGWLVDERTPQALAAGLRWALATSRDELSRIASASVAELVPERALAPIFADHRVLAEQLGPV